MSSQQEADGPDNMYPLPLYLNQKYVFDVLAMMQEGLSQLQNVKTTQTDQQEALRRFSGDVGVKNVFGLFGLSLGAERTNKKQQGDVQEMTTERIFTPNALFARMREWLYEDGLLPFSELSASAPGSFVEFQVVLRKNPLVETLESVLSAIQIVIALGESPQSQPGNQQGRRAQGMAQQPAESESEKRLRQIQGLLDQVNGQSTSDLVGTIVGQEQAQAILTIDKAYLGDPSLSDLIDGQYTVLGKVVRVLPKDSGETIDLLRKTVLGRFPQALLDQLMGGFLQSKAAGFRLPELEMEIKAPAIQVLPIAIFV